MENITFTRLLAFIADCHEVDKETKSTMKPEFRQRQLLQKFPTLTKNQVKHILRILC